MAGKALDISRLSYKGINFNFLSKPGLQGRNHYDTNGTEAVRSIMGGFLFTCGTENICAPCNWEGTDYPLHGRIRSTPSEHNCADAYWEEDHYKITVQGEIREALLFGENVVLRRKIETVYDSNAFSIIDEYENESYKDVPLMLLYHINLGYPFLCEDTILYLHTDKVSSKDKFGEEHEGRYHVMEAPKDNEPEYVFSHEIKRNANQDNIVIVVNPKLNLGIQLTYNMKNLPYFHEWKSIASGDYVLGIEPANSAIFGRVYHEKNNSVHKIAPFTKEKIVLSFKILDGEEEINDALHRFHHHFK